MTVGTSAPIAGPFTSANGLSLPFGFKVFVAGDVRVRRTVGGATIDLTLGTHYAVALNANQNNAPGGTVTLTQALPAGATITLSTRVPLSQPTVWQNRGGFYPKVVEDALDRATMQIKQIGVESAEAAAQAAQALSDVRAAQASLTVVNQVLSDLSTYTTGLASTVDGHTVAIGNQGNTLSAHGAALTGLQTATTANTGALAQQAASINGLVASQSAQDSQIAGLANAVAALTGVPVVTTILIDPATNITEATPVSYTAVTTSAQPILEWDWTFWRLGQFVGTSSDPLPTRQNVDQVQVRARNAAGWGVALGRNVPVGVVTPVVTDIVHNAPASTVPLGTVIALSPVYTGGGAFQWEWTFTINNGGPIVTTLTNPSFTSNVLEGLFRASLRVRNPAGWSQVYSEDIAVFASTAGVAPSITVQPNGGTITQGRTRTLSVTAAGTAPLLYQWSRNGAEIAGATTAAYDATLAGDYTVVVTNGFGNIMSSTATIVVIPQPVPAFSATPTVGAVPLVVTFTNESLNVIAGDIYSWIFGDGDTSTSAAPGQHTYTAGGVRTALLRITRDGVVYGPASQQITISTTPVILTAGGNDSDIALAIADTNLYDGAPTTPQDGLGYVRLQNDGEIAHYLLRGDVEAAAAAYAAANTGTVGGTASGYVLELYQYAASAQAFTCNIHRVSGTPPTIAQATWNSRATGTAWATPGGDLGPVIGTISVGGAVGVKQSTDLAPNIDAAADGIIVVAPAGMPLAFFRPAESTNNGQPGPRWRLTFPAVGSGGGGGGGGGGGSATRVIAGNFPEGADFDACPFVNVVHQMRGFGAPTEYDESATIARDAQGWPLEATRAVITTAADKGSAYKTGVFKGYFRDNTGTPATMTVSATGNSSVSNIVRVGDTVTFDWTVTGPPALILNFSAGVRDLRIVHPGYDPAASNLPYLLPEAVEYLAKYHALRFMDLMKTNNNPATWATKAPIGKRCGGRKSWDFLAAVFSEVFNAPGSLCKRAWVCVPYGYNEADCLALAQLLGPLLPPTCIVQSEHGNEKWNFLFTLQWAHYTAIATTPAHPDYARIDVGSGGDMYYRMGAAWTLDSMRMSRAFRTVFPQARHEHILSAQHADQSWIKDRMLPWAAAAAQVAEFGTVPSWLYMIATAPYTSGDYPEMVIPANAVEFIKSLNGDPTAVTTFTYSLPVVAFATTGPIGSMVRLKTLADQYGVKAGSYETGVHSDGSGNEQVKYDTHLHPNIAAHITALIEAHFTAGLVQATYFHAGAKGYTSTDVHSFCWAIIRGYQLTVPAQRTPKWDALEQLLTAP